MISPEELAKAKSALAKIERSAPITISTPTKASEPKVEKPIELTKCKKRNGFMTIAMCNGIEIAIYHKTMIGLELVFNTVTRSQVPFRSDYVSQVIIYNQ